MSRARNLAGFGSAVTSVENPVNIQVGYVTAIAYYGDGSELTGTPGGLGTALSDNLSDPLNKIYYTNANLSIASTITVDPPQSASAAYTQYTDIVMQGDADLIVGDGDDFIPDILGIGTFVDMPGVLAGGNSKVRADNYTDKLGTGAAYGPYGFVAPVGVAVTVGSGTSISSPATNQLALGTNNTEALRIDSGGRLLLGTNSARSDFFNANTVAPSFQVQGTGNARIASITAVDTSSASGASLILAKSRSTGNTIVQDNDTLGALEFQGSDGSEIIVGAQIKAQVDGTPGANDMPTRLMFGTTADGASAQTERLRILSDGAVIVGDGTNWTKYVSDANFQITDNTNAKLVISNPGNSSYSLAVGTDNALTFRNEATAVNNMLINYTTNDIEIVDGNLKVASGHGIDFSATSDGSGTNTSELLDDYETGNWTPVLKSSTDVITVTGSQNYYRYIKIGRLVTLFYSINNATTSGTTGGVCTIAGLPFAASASTANNRFISGDVMFYNTGFKLDAWPLYPHSASGDLTVNFYSKASAGAQYNSANVNTVGAGSYFFFTFTYYTD